MNSLVEMSSSQRKKKGSIILIDNHQGNGQKSGGNGSIDKKSMEKLMNNTSVTALNAKGEGTEKALGAIGGNNPNTASQSNRVVTRAQLLKQFNMDAF
jgi:hypothetical protein